MKPWLNRIRTYLSRVLAVPDTEHLYDDDPMWQAGYSAHHFEHCEADDPVRYYRGRSGDDDEWPVHGEDPRP